jgi:hypothetical protein
MTDVCINVGIMLGSVAGFVCEQTITNPNLIWSETHTLHTPYSHTSKLELANAVENSLSEKTPGPNPPPFFCFLS